MAQLASGKASTAASRFKRGGPFFCESSRPALARMPKRPTASTAGTSIAADAGDGVLGLGHVAWDMAENITLPLPAPGHAAIIRSRVTVRCPAAGAGFAATVRAARGAALRRVVATHCWLHRRQCRALTADCLGESHVAGLAVSACWRSRPRRTCKSYNVGLAREARRAMTLATVMQQPIGVEFAMTDFRMSAHSQWRTRDRSRWIAAGGTTAISTAMAREWSAAEAAFYVLQPPQSHGAVHE